MDKWTKISSSYALNEKWFKVRKEKVKLPNGRVLDDYYIWESGDVAMVAPVTPEGKFIVVKQYKHGAGEVMIEFPAGYLNDNEKPDEAARREIFEETGYELTNLQRLAKNIHQPTKENGVVYIFLAEVKGVPKEHSNMDENEEIELLELTKTEFLEMIRTGEIWADGTITTFFLALDKLGLLQVSKIGSK